MNCSEGITGPADDILIGRVESDVIIEMWTGLISEITALYRDTVTGLSPLTTPVTRSILPDTYKYSHFNFVSYLQQLFSQLESFSSCSAQYYLH